ncbi:MAG: hypothetical protein ACE5HB_03675 [Terriglobia bacterium]
MRVLPSGFRSLLAVLLAASLLLAACDDFERNAYRTLKVAKVEYELLQEHAAQGFVEGDLSEEQWDRFAAAGRRFIASHTLAADLMKTYQRARRARGEAASLERQAIEQQVAAVLSELPVLLADLRSLIASFDASPAG